MTALELAERALELAAHRTAEIVVQSERSTFARFAGTEVHQPTLVENTVVQMSVFEGDRVGAVSSNRVDEQGLEALLARADEAAASAPPRSPATIPAEPAELPAVAGYDPATAALAPAEQAGAARTALDAAAPLGAYGYVTSGACELAIASSAGARSEQRFTDAVALVIAAADGASGYAGQSAWRAGELDPAAVARDAAATAERTRDAQGLEAGTYRAVLTPYALGELLQWFGYYTFSGLALLEERSFLTGRIGNRVFDPTISLADDALDPRGFPKAFDFEGSPKRRVELVEEGVVRNVVWDRATAAQAGSGRRSTGHALSARERSFGPMPLALSLAAGEAESLEELAERVGGGIFVTRVHYLGVVDEREGIITGTTRDGTFRIRAGRIAEPLVNLRFAVSITDLLGEVLGLTRETTLVNQSDFYDERYPYGTLAPGLATTRFAVTGTGAGPGL